MARGKVNVSETEVRYFTSTGKEVILVNPWNYMPEDYTVKIVSHNGYRVAEECLAPLKAMLAACKKAGYTALVRSSFRTHDDQIYLFENKVKYYMNQGYSREEAEKLTSKVNAIPGTSEHELGLAVDLVDGNNYSLDESQESTPAQKWLMENCWDYGWILRYPNEKTEVTGIIYEPWHYRYVGKEVAKELQESGLCLEEYLASLC
jgi:D-alanyl-D-alanine carboxypeptidase